MDSAEEELEQITTWLTEEGCAPDSPKEAQLCVLWRGLQSTRACLSSATREQDMQRSQHLAEMAEVRKSLEQIRIFTEQKDVLAQLIQDENDQLKDQLRQLISLQDAQTSEVAKMLHQQGLTELIPSSPSEQVAYLLVERASLQETSEHPTNSNSNSLMSAGDSSSPPRTETQVSNSNVRQSPHKGAPHHGHSPWRRLLFGLHKASQSKHSFIPAEARHSSGQSSSVEKKCSLLERDLEEGSRRLAMAHNEIRHLTDELESAHLTQKTYEPELQAAQQEVEKLKMCETELRKAKELNDRLDFEIRVLRNRVRSLDAEKSSLQQMVVSLQEEVEQLESDLQERQQQIHTVQLQAEQANELAKSRETELNQSIQVCRDLQNSLSAQKRCILEESQIYYLKQHLGFWNQKEADWKHRENWKQENSFTKEGKEQQLNKENTQNKEFGDDSVRTLLSSQDECETLKKEICETLKCLDKERSKYHQMKEKHKVKLCRAKQKFDDETTWRDEKIKGLERELSLCSHSLTKEKELVVSITAENEKLLAERTRLFQQLNEEEHNKQDTNLTAALSKCRVTFLEVENKTLGEKLIHMSNQLTVLERTVQSQQSRHFAECDDA
ncbi:coiled-coil domain-containing protein 30 isoform X1 [Hippoglossus stenolepis]|uniref:coiled-coil domain-containing protein 30 isoform X1 n=1 Tax=Hippoglossus stenolepis TaxID=195615 RepID=UPI00159CBE64|nr:coiled-coil domain-containing protein 30 isoform X1 [Hippoglossus stenolepis]